MSGINRLTQPATVGPAYLHIFDNKTDANDTDKITEETAQGYSFTCHHLFSDSLNVHTDGAVNAKNLLSL